MRRRLTRIDIEAKATQMLLSILSINLLRIEEELQLLPIRSYDATVNIVRYVLSPTQPNVASTVQGDQHIVDRIEDLLTTGSVNTYRYRSG